MKVNFTKATLTQLYELAVHEQCPLEIKWGAVREMRRRQKKKGWRY